MRFFGLRSGAVHVVCAVALTSFSARAANIYVDCTSICPGNGALLTPYCTIQAAIADPFTVAGDTVIVSPCTYLENIDFLGKAITVTSTFPHDPAIVHTTIIDGSGAGPIFGEATVTCDTGEGPDTQLFGFVIKNGAAIFSRGMLNVDASPTVAFCSFIGNFTLSRGGGMYNMGVVSGSSPTVAFCSFIQNRAGNPGGAGRGGGMYNEDNSAPAVVNTWFIGNTASASGSGNGGGVHNDNSNPFFIDCSFSANAAGGGFTGGGGGMSNDGSSPFLVRVEFCKNTTANGSGGGMSNENGSSPTLVSCSFSANTALEPGGGGMYNNGALDSPSVDFCSFNVNQAVMGGGMFNRGLATSVTRCTFTGNEAIVGLGGGGGIFDAGTLSLQNTGFCRQLAGGATFGVAPGVGNSLTDCWAVILPKSATASSSEDRNGDGRVDAADFLTTLPQWIREGQRPPAIRKNSKGTAPRYGAGD